jgi:hypothetical protein
MLRLLADENFNGDIVRGLRLRRPEIDLVRAQEVGLRGVDDPAVLAWAAANDRILLTHDQATMPEFACDRLGAGDPLPGVFLLSDRFPIGDAIREILALDEISDHAEWAGRIIYLPL